jgi:quercetin dioxygenase-like cupin family protein
MRCVLITSGAVLLLAAVGTIMFSAAETSGEEQGVTEPHPMVVNLDPATKGYARVLPGPPSTYSMRSGHVVLAPGQSVGKHSTGGFEEVVIVFEGKGKMTITDGPELTLAQGSVAYCPPHREHDVTNTGSQPLRYLYVVAAAPSTAD